MTPARNPNSYILGSTISSLKLHLDSGRTSSQVETHEIDGQFLSVCYEAAAATSVSSCPLLPDGTGQAASSEPRIPHLRSGDPPPSSPSVWRCWCAPGREPILPTLKHRAGGRGGLEGCSSCLRTTLHFRLFVFMDRRTPASYLARRGTSVDTFGPVLRAWGMGKACCDLWLQAVPKPKKCSKLGWGAKIQLHQGPLDTCCRALEALGLPHAGVLYGSVI